MDSLQLVLKVLDSEFTGGPFKLVVSIDSSPKLRSKKIKDWKKKFKPVLSFSISDLHLNILEFNLKIDEILEKKVYELKVWHKYS